MMTAHNSSLGGFNMADHMRTYLAVAWGANWCACMMVDLQPFVLRVGLKEQWTIRISFAKDNS
jgi:hypothetical protein